MNWPNMNTNILIKTLSLYLKLRSKHHENSELSLRRLLHNAITHKLEFRKKTHNRVRAGFSPALPTPPDMRVRIRRFIAGSLAIGIVKRNPEFAY